MSNNKNTDIRNSKFGWALVGAAIVALLAGVIFYVFSDTKVVGKAGATQINNECKEKTVTKYEYQTRPHTWNNWGNNWFNGECSFFAELFGTCRDRVKSETTYYRYGYGEWEEGSCPEPEPSVTPEPTKEPEVTPTPTDMPNGNKVEDKGNGQAVCENPVNTVANFHVYRNGDLAILKWFKTAGDKVNIYWQNLNDSNDKHALAKVDNSGYKEIGGLGRKDWRFGISQECGNIVWVDDGDTSNWVLFRNPYIR